MTYGRMEIVPPRLRPLLDVPIAFAHRGARAHAPENTIESFRLALRLGATGLESDVWLTADGVAVLDHDGAFGPRFRRRQICDLRRDQLPEHIPTLEEFYDQVTTSVPLSLDVKDPRAFDAVVSVARNVDAEHHLWLCHPEFDQLLPWRQATEAKLVDSTRLSKISEGVERRAFRMRDNGIDAINLRHMDWSGGTIAMFHRFERYTLGWDAQHPREIANLIDAGIDGVFSDHSDRLAAELEHFFPNQGGATT